MSLFKVAQEFPTTRSYIFANEHKPLWSNFWINMDGDMDKLLKFAENVGIADPKAWFEELHWFLFDVYCGNDKIYKNAATTNFASFLRDIVKNHQTNPKPGFWYSAKGTSHKDFLRIFEKASLFENCLASIQHINARLPDFGAKVYSEWILTKTPKASELKSIASKKLQEANKIEQEVIGKKSFNVGDKLYYFDFDDELEVTAVINPKIKKLSFKDIEAGNVNSCLVCKDSKGVEHRIYDTNKIF